MLPKNYSENKFIEYFGKTNVSVQKMSFFQLKKNLIRPL